MNEEELLPRWAVELTKQVAILNEKIPNHIDWVERNVKDHETRLRLVENTKADRIIEERVDRLESRLDQSAWAGRIGWLFLGGGVAAIVTVFVTQTFNLY